MTKKPKTKKPQQPQPAQIDPALAAFMKQYEESNKLIEAKLCAALAELALKENSKPKPPPPNVIIEELPNLSLEVLMIKLAQEVLTAWTKQNITGQNSRQLNVFKCLQSNPMQELMKEIQVRNEK